ncbi:MAG: dihydroneopterin aldolase [Bacillota bacterium]
MDKIVLRDMKFYGYHGVLPAEKAVGQPFIVSVEIFTDLTQAGLTDNLEDTINYAQIYREIKEIVEGKSFNLIEALGQEIAVALLRLYEIPKVKVIIDKPEAPVPGGTLEARVEIMRVKNDEFKLGLLKLGQ